jgi:hypothetical protein
MQITSLRTSFDLSNKSPYHLFPTEVQYESLGTSHEIYGHYLIIRSTKDEIRCIRTTLGHIFFYREIEEAIQGCTEIRV